MSKNATKKTTKSEPKPVAWFEIAGKGGQRLRFADPEGHVIGLYSWIVGR